MECRNRNSCRCLFKILNILPLISHYIFSLLIFLVNNENHLTINADKYNIFTRQRYNLHLPQENLTIFSKEVVMQEPKFLLVLLLKLRLFQIILRNLKLHYNFFVFTPFFCTPDEYFNR
jgi:hypothetical protein